MRAFLIAVTVILSSLGAVAQEIGREIVCDTAEQVEQYALSPYRGLQEALDAINKPLDKVACAMVVIIFVRGNAVKSVTVNGSIYEIVQVTVIGVPAPSGIQPVVPTIQYTAFRLEDKGA